MFFDENSHNLRDIITGNVNYVKRKHTKRCMIYPDQPFKARWDLFITL